MSESHNSGLDGVVAAATVLSLVDGANGRLVIRGASLDELAGRTSFEALVRRLLDGFFELPDEPTFGRALGLARQEAFAAAPVLDATVLALPPYEAVRALTARLPDGQSLLDALRLLAAPAVFGPMVVRAQAGAAPVAPDPAAGHSADILRMLRGRAASAGEAGALDAYLVTVSDHGLNASTFTARVIASTGAGLASAVLGGMGALYGPLHGGAPGPVLDMLDAIGAAEAAEAWLDRAIGSGERLMGFGHRIYRVRDPRADALKAALARLDPDAGRLRLAEAVEQAALAVLRRRKPGRPLETNVEFYTALLLEALGFPRALFTGVFAMGRTAGWLAHAREQAATGRLIRPESRYVGPQPQAPLAA
jgi:citrate synthase